MPVKVLLADDHSIVREGLKAVLKRTAPDIIVAGEACDGNQALELAKKTPADVYVFDITMPALNGLEAMARLLRRDKKAKIIILSMHDDKPTIEKAVRAGARGYIIKESAAEEIVRAVREVYAGRHFLSPSVSGIDIDDILDAPFDKLKRQSSALTSREKEIIQQIAEGLGDKQIAYKFRISRNTVHVHRHNISLKLDIHKQTDLVRYAIKEGIAKL